MRGILHPIVPKYGLNKKMLNSQKIIAIEDTMKHDNGYTCGTRCLRNKFNN